MKNAGLWLFMFVLFSIAAEFAATVTVVQAEDKGIQLIEEKELKLSYIYKEETDQLRLDFEHKSKEVQQRLKIRVTDEKGEAVDCSEAAFMVEKEGWLIEENFSAGRAGQLLFHVTDAVGKLYVYVQMDRWVTADTGEATIEENILERTEPYILAAGTDGQETMTSDHTQTKDHNSLLKEAIVGPKQLETEQTGLSVNKTRSMYEPLYVNKAPRYKTDSKGTYPEFAWQPEGQTNVLNHQGGDENQTDWDNVVRWDVAADSHEHSYVKYGEDSANANIQLRKYAQQTAKEDEFKIKLNVRGNTTYKPGVDILFLLDNTGSMSSGGSTKKADSVKALGKILDELEKVADPSTGGIRIGGHIFASYDKAIEETWGWTREKTHHPLSSDPADWRKIETSYKELTAAGGTFTQRGLQEAQDIFNDPETDTGNERHKLLFILTDGAPTSSWMPLTAEKNDSIFYDPTLVTSFAKGIKPAYSSGLSLGAEGNKSLFTSPLMIDGQKITSHLTTTNSTAYQLKNDGIEIHSLAVKITSSGKDHSGQELLRGLYKMATKKANVSETNDQQSDYFFYHAENSSELTEYVKAWYQRIIRTVDMGEITDPLGDRVDFVTSDDKKPIITQVDNGAPKIEAADLPILSTTDRQIKVENVNLTANQEIEIEYTVSLKTNEIVSNQWYQTNKTTTLKPTPERTTDVIEFGSPSVRLQKTDFVIPVKKIWADDEQGTADYWNLRPEKVTVTLQKWDGKAWQAIEARELSTSNNWQAKFSAVKGSEENTYRVVEDVRTKGYKAPTINQDSFTSETIAAEGIEITNELLRGSYSFSKYMEDGKTPLTVDLPKFTIMRSDGKVLVQEVTPNREGKVLLNDVPIGVYIVEEVYVPAGFQKMTNFELHVTEDASATGLVFKVNDSIEPYIAMNTLKDFSLQVEKVDSLKNPLEGASFKLTGPNYEETKQAGPVFTFTKLRPGSYTLTEVENPEGYQRLEEPILFEIALDGKVTILPHKDVVGTSAITEESNRIDLKVSNTKVKAGVLPSTGGNGIRLFYLTAILLVASGFLLTSFSLYLNRGKK
ncbi:vWA domain-containing protein [Enterococcus sp. AZ196]|uniref:vWA domain-containing protein n=1 Tax=Enterococcus sp. AZ196 TaxID=2774659 RepID=UPI003D2E63CC